MLNPRIGEIELTIGAETYTIKPTFNVLAQIERLAEGSLVNIMKLNSLANISTAFHLALKAAYGNKAPNMDEVGHYVMTTGQVPAFNKLSEFLEPVIIGYDEAEKKKAQRDKDKEKSEGNAIG